ncbi:SOS response-associated peptidase [Micromonospora sp. CPCC 206060]|uniref:SOS response-associated peptidase n=1 Tax=Micromonospora sp. CPCC 206060 TaxID=3122406 RepID=UPI002FF0638B
MCGRYATTRSAADLGALFEAYDDSGGRLAVDYNVAPTTPVPVVRVADGVRTLSLARWGLVPSWAKTPTGGARMINARVETVATSQAYAAPFHRHRCLVPADGWYEWVRAEDGRKQPYYLTPGDGRVLAFAGLWSVWRGADTPLTTCTVLTTGAAGALAAVHPRMPLLLPEERWAAWLAEGPGSPELLVAPDEEWLAGIEIRPVGAAVGNVRNNGPQLIERVSVPSPRATADPAEMTLF